MNKKKKKVTFSDVVTYQEYSPPQLISNEDEDSEKRLTLATFADKIRFRRRVKQLDSMLSPIFLQRLSET